MILLANVTVAKARLPQPRQVYLALFLALLLNWLVPPGVFLGQSFFIKSLGPAFLLALPLFFAGLVFARLFSEARDPGRIYGSIHRLVSAGSSNTRR